MNLDQQPVRIAGAGPTGALLAILLARRGMHVTLFERRSDPRQSPGGSGRSINLALAGRGIHALKVAGVFDDLALRLIPMTGRVIHHLDGATVHQPYGHRPGEHIYSISRHLLNQVLLDVAIERHGVRVHFEHRLAGADFGTGTAFIHDQLNNRQLSVPMRPMLVCDGAGSAMRRLMAAQQILKSEERDLEHGYKELSIPAGEDGRHRMAGTGLHIWPRGDFMMIALPNDDGSFTATLFMAANGRVSLESLNSDRAIDDFFRTYFPDAYTLMPNCVAEFRTNPLGILGTVYAYPWHHRGDLTLVGDAAHAIVPFHGQGMNCCFEDCVELDALLGTSPSWERAFADFGAVRKPNTDAIAKMAIENYLEMREHVAESRFQHKRALALELEKRHPDRFIPRYSMVTFHSEISYATAQQRGLIQEELLEELTAKALTLEDVDFSEAARAIEGRLPKIV
jgi:kynurenine 3-monooxygenase